MKPSDRVERIAALPLWAAPLLRACGIYSVDEVASHTPETLAARLRERILFELTPARIEAEDWIGQARRLSVADRHRDRDVPANVEGEPAELDEPVEQPQPAEPGERVRAEAEPAEPGGPTESPHESTPIRHDPAGPPDDPAVDPDLSSDAAADAVDAPRSGTWRQLGGFTVFVDAVNDRPRTGHGRVRVYHDESGEEVTLPTVEPGPWTAWILNKVFEEQEPTLYHLIVTIDEATATTSAESDISVGVTLRVDGLERLERALGGATVGVVLGKSREQDKDR